MRSVKRVWGSARLTARRNVRVTYVVRTLVRRCEQAGASGTGTSCPPVSGTVQSLRTSPYNSVRAWSAPSCGITRPGMLGGGYGCGPAERRRSQGAAPPLEASMTATRALDPVERAAVDAPARPRPCRDTTGSSRPDFSVAISRALGTIVVTVHGALSAGTCRQLRSVLWDVIDQQALVRQPRYRTQMAWRR